VINLVDPIAMSSACMVKIVVGVHLAGAHFSFFNGKNMDAFVE
jgi:hypothetical protein